MQTTAIRLLGLAALVAFVACNGALLRIDVAQSTSTTIREGTVLEALLEDFTLVDLPGMDITASQELANQGVQPGDIQEVFLTTFVLTATSPSGADLAFLDSLDVFVSGPDLPTVRIASSTTFPQGQARVELDLDDVDLTDYVVSQSMTVSVEADGTRPGTDTELAVDFVLSVGVTAQGACNAITGGVSAE